MGNEGRVRLQFCARVCAGALLSVALAAAAQTDEWVPELVLAKGTFQPVGAPIVIALPELPAGALDGIAVELDANDVTSLVSLAEDGRSLVLSPEVPMKAGPHSLRLVQGDADGNLVERGSWQLEVRESAAFRELQFAWNPAASLQGSERIAARKESEEASSLTGSGSMKPAFKTDSGNWVNSGHAEFMYDSNAAQTGAERVVDAGDFILESGNENLVFKAGHHFPGPVAGTRGSSLIVDQAPRRGLSGTWGIRRWPTNVSLLALRTDALHGFEHGFGVGDSNNRIDGMLFDTLIYSSGEDRVKMLLGHVTGAGEQGGTAIGDPATSVQLVDPGQAGDASNFVLESQWSEKQVTMRAETARVTRNIGYGISDITDNAHTLLFAYTPKRGPMFGDLELAWDAQLSHQKIGSLFRSIGSPGGSADVDATSLVAGAVLGEVSSSLALSSSEDNVNGFLFPTTRVKSGFISFDYAPQFEQDLLPAWLNQPSLHLEFGKGSSRNTKFPAGSNASPIDLDSTANSFSTNFVLPLDYGTWGFSFSPAKLRDHVGVASQTTRDTSLYGDFLVTERYRFKPSLALGRVRFSDDVVEKTRDVTIAQTVELLPQVLVLSLAVSRKQTELSDGSQDSTGHDAALDLGWQTPFLRGLTLWLSASYLNAKDRPDPIFGSMDMFGVADDKDHQIFLGFDYAFSPPQ